MCNVKDEDDRTEESRCFHHLVALQGLSNSFGTFRSDFIVDEVECGERLCAM